MIHKCKYHPKIKTEFRCSKCKDYVCNDCLEYKYDRIYCKKCLLHAKKIGIKLVILGSLISSLIVILFFFVLF